jgi:cold-inducible RNA-binding protein
MIMSKNLYVGNLSFSTTADDLREAFSQFGTVTRAQVVSDRDTGRSRGFGFVEMDGGAEEAIAALNGTQFQGRTLTVNEAKPREDRQGGDRPQRTGGSSSRRY